MSDANPQAVSVKILDREYWVSCTPQERPHLLAAAAMVDERMRDLRQQSRTAGIDRIAVLVALNLANELQQLKQNQQSVQGALGGDILNLRRKLEAGLSLLGQRA